MLNHFMVEAMKMAKLAYDNDEVPVGAIIVKNEKIIGRGFNQVITKNSVSSHAEINAINQASKFANNYRPLHVVISNIKASKHDIYNMCEFLINKGALTYVNTCYHKTPLHLICKNGISDFDDNFDELEN